MNGSDIPICITVTTKQLVMIRGFSITSPEVLKGRAKVEFSGLTFHVLTAVYLIFQCYDLLLDQKDYNESLEAQ